MGLTWYRCGRRAEICIIHATSHLEPGRGRTCALWSGIFIMLTFAKVRKLRQEAQTTRLNISPSLHSCGLAALTPEERAPSGPERGVLQMHISLRCAQLTCESQSLLCLPQIWHQWTAGETQALLPASPDANQP